MIREKGSLGIRDVLKEKNVDLWKRLEGIWRNAEPMFRAIEKAVGKPAAEAHSIEVERDISALIPDDRKEELEPIELFSLSVAACLHDADKALGTPKGKHGDVASANVGIYPEDYDLDRGQADVVRWIIRMHDHGDFRYDLPPDPLPIGGGIHVYIKPLAALFRLADILHADYRRVVSARPEEAKDRARICIRGWKYDDGGRIVFRAVPEEIPDIEHIHKAIAMMREAIEYIAPILRDAGYAHEIADTEIDNSILKDKVRAKHEKTQKSERSFIGMDSFNEDDEHLFRGREKESNELYELLLLDDPIIALVGDSGTGKTSLIRAGLFPILRKMGWQFAYTRPLHDPPSDVIRDVWLKMMKGKVPDSIDLVEMFERVSEENRGKDLLIVMDQFEDLFRFPDAPEQMAKALYPVQAVRFRDLRILLSYRADAEGRVGPILQDVARSLRAMPKMYIQPLNRDGAAAALTTGFGVAQVGLSPRGLIKLILDDIEAQGSGFYPPYIQMMGETLVDNAENGIFTKVTYDSLGGVANVIGNYLLNQIELFGAGQEDAKRILVELTSVASPEGRKARTRLAEDLERDLGMDNKALTDLLGDMVKRRLIRPVGNGQYEIIHDHLAKLVDENLIAVGGEREFRQLRERLAAAAASYVNMQLLLEPAFMMRLYHNRDRVNPSSDEKKILFHSCLAGNGPAWYWFKDSPQEEYLPILRSALLHPSTCRVAASILGGIDNREAIAGSMELLKNKNRYVRMAAVTLLGQLGTRQDIAELMEALEDSSTYVQEAAAEALAMLATQENIPELSKMLIGGNWNVRRTAAEALARLFNRMNIPELGRMLANENWNIRIIAVEALAQLDAKEAIPQLMQMLKDRNGKVKEVAAEALAQLDAKEAIPQLIEMLMDEGSFSRQKVTEALVRLDAKEAIPQLIGMQEDMNWDVQIMATEALAQLGVKEAVLLLMEMLMDEDNDVRGTAAEALAQSGTTEAVPLLMEMLTDEDNDVRGTAAEALEQLGATEAVPLLMEMLTDEEWDVRKKVAKAVVSLDAREDVPKLKEMLKSKDGYIQREAIEKLVQMDAKEAIPELMETLDDRDLYAREKAEEVMKLIARRSTPELLIKLKYRNRYIRIGLAKELARRGAREAIPELIELLEDKRRDVSKSVTEALLELGAQDAIPKLRGMLRNRSSNARITAARALGTLGSEEDLQPLQKLILSGDRSMSTARYALISVDHKLYCPFEWPEGGN